MPRRVKLQESQVQFVFKKKEDLIKEIVREYQLVTPIYGGGEEPNRPDSVTLIRASSIKGQLRFWWRAIRGWKSDGKISKLLSLEERIWGGVSVYKQSSRVTLALEIVSPELGKEKVLYENVRNVPKYAVFPLMRLDSNVRAQALLKEVRFRLKLRIVAERQKEKGEQLSLKDLVDEVEAALWAWEVFGGIGARTRRGFGAMKRVDKEVDHTMDAIKGKLAQYSSKESKAWPKGVPHLRPDSSIAVLNDSWHKVVDFYHRFRQYRPETRIKDGEEVPGPNKWPEAMLIRWAYAPDRSREPNLVVAPRAQFGLPVPFFFLGEPYVGKKGKATLTGKRAPQNERIDRLASPLIIRPLDKGKTLLAVLESPRFPPGGVFLDPKPKARSVQEGIGVRLDDHEAELLVEAGLDVLKIDGQVYTDPVLAFFECVQSPACRSLLERVHVGR